VTGGARGPREAGAGDGGWTVRSKDPSRRDPFVAEEFAKAERWVMDNWRQYQRVIMGG